MREVYCHVTVICCITTDEFITTKVSPRGLLDSVNYALARIRVRRVQVQLLYIFMCYFIKSRPTISIVCLHSGANYSVIANYHLEVNSVHLDL